MPALLDAQGRTLTDRVVLALAEEPWSTARDLADELGARQVSVACILLDLYMRRRAERVMGRRRGSRQRVWSYRLVGAVPEHLL